MSAPAGLMRARVVPGTDLRRLLHQTLDSLERASIAAEMLAAHGVIRSMTFELLCNALGEALESASAIEAAMQRRPTLVFPTATMAQDFCAKHPLDGGRSYEIHADGAGRATISVNLLVEYL